MKNVVSTYIPHTQIGQFYFNSFLKLSKGGEMTQALYAHMNKKKKKLSIYKTFVKDVCATISFSYFKDCISKK
jgi:hypothetical protein